MPSSLPLPLRKSLAARAKGSGLRANQKWLGLATPFAELLRRRWRRPGIQGLASKLLFRSSTKINDSRRGGRNTGHIGNRDRRIAKNATSQFFGENTESLYHNSYCRVTELTRQIQGKRRKGTFDGGDFLHCSFVGWSRPSGLH